MFGMKIRRNNIAILWKNRRCYRIKHKWKNYNLTINNHKYYKKMKHSRNQKKRNKYNK